MKKHINLWLVMFLAISLALPLCSMAQTPLKLRLLTETGDFITTNQPIIKNFFLSGDGILAAILDSSQGGLNFTFAADDTQIGIRNGQTCTISNYIVTATAGNPFQFEVYSDSLGATISAPALPGGSWTNGASPRTFQWTTSSGDIGTYLAVFQASASDKKTSQIVVMINIVSSQQYNVSISASPAVAAATLTGAGTYSAGQSVTVNTTAASGYTFNYWSENTTSVSTSASYTFTMPSNNRILVANFTSTSSQYTMTTSASPSGAGTVSGAGTYNANTSVTVTATPNQGYTFSSWGGDAYGSVNPTTVTMNGNKNVIATFSAASNCTRLDWGLQTTITLQAGAETCYVATVDSGRSLMWIDLYGITQELEATVTWIFPGGTTTEGYLVADKVNTGIKFRSAVPPGEYQFKINCTRSGSILTRTYLY
jgi:hypothetical protein